MRRTILGAAAAGALLVTLSACGDSAAPSTGTMSVMFTDAPFPFDQVARADMYVVRVDAKLAETTEEEAADVDDDAAASIDGESEPNHDPRRGWVTIATPMQTYNLLDLQNGSARSLGETTLPTGRYRGFRLILDTDKSTITLTDGTVLNGNATPGIVWPSAGRTGIKVNFSQPITLDADGTVAVLDFDLGNSFVLRGNTIEENGLLFKPVIRVTTTDVTGAVAGTVSCAKSDGTSTPVDAGSVEVLKHGTDILETSPDSVIATTSTDPTGQFHFGFLMPGDYTVRATRPAGDATCALSALRPTVTVSTGTTADASVELPAN